ncbi:MAG: DUF4440 domain-containing protein [Bacteroidota bacterium]
MRYLLICLMALPFYSFAQDLKPSDEAAIKEVMESQRTGWNQGDIDCFMEGYWNSDELLFVGSNGVNKGWKATIERYKTSYPDKATMGELTFTYLKFRKLGPKSAYLLGKFHLKRDMGDAEGYFTLVLKKIKGQWLIISDHSS